MAKINATATMDANLVLTITDRFGHVNVVKPVQVFTDGTASYTSAMDFCGTCDRSMNYYVTAIEN